MPFTHQPTTPAPPEAWLAVSGCPPIPDLHCFSICESPSEAEVIAKERNWRLPKLDPMHVVKDDPQLPIRHGGIFIQNAACLKARDNWFFRYSAILDGLLSEPKIATVFTYTKGKLLDPLSSFRAPSGGPCPLPKKTAWPSCPQCRQKMAFLGVLDFRNAATARTPCGSLVIHKCADWGCYERECSSAIWIMPGDDYAIVGESPDSQALISQMWQTTDYAFNFSKLDGTFREKLPSETGIYQNPSSVADKVGGHFYFIQDEPHVPDSEGKQMTCIGQITGCEYIELGDCGSGYIFWSPRTGETAIAFQDY